MGICANIQSKLIASKQERMSPSKIQVGDAFLPSTMKHCSMASAGDR